MEQLVNSPRGLFSLVYFRHPSIIGFFRHPPTSAYSLPSIEINRCQKNPSFYPTISQGRPNPQYEPPPRSKTSRRGGPSGAAAGAGQAPHDVRAGAPLPLPQPSIAAAAEPRRRRALSGGGGRGRARCLPRAQHQRDAGFDVATYIGALQARRFGRWILWSPRMASTHDLVTQKLCQTSGGRRVHHRRAVQRQRYDWNNQLLMSVQSTSMPFVQLLEAVACLINLKLSWNCKVVGYLQQKKIYCLFRGIISAVPQNARNMEHCDISAMEQVLMLTASHVGGNQCCCPAVDPSWSFSLQLLSILLASFAKLQEGFLC
ncbi:hypothetical protein VPH35_028665 [Triticum aestivum]|uniref:Uncharacterized protein n=1 Tax=Triticum turgidum subsp. durum TaxID=4567 RepID=A0A9R1PLM6_TRITD|nr:unnamed protein product [Triticum turgidum subsp. durum]